MNTKYHDINKIYISKICMYTQSTLKCIAFVISYNIKEIKLVWF